MSQSITNGTYTVGGINQPGNINSGIVFGPGNNGLMVGPGLGGGLMGGVVTSVSLNNDPQPSLYKIMNTNIFFRDQKMSNYDHAPKGNLEIPDALYPAAMDFTCVYERFHFTTWACSNNYESLTKLWDDLDTFSNPKYITFRNRQARNRYVKWYQKYSKRFDGDMKHFFPPIKTGKMNGAFVAEPSRWLDNSNMNPNESGEQHKLDMGLNEAMPSWAWIVANSKKNVYRIRGGWFFESMRDAALYKMFDPKQHPITWALTE